MAAETGNSAAAPGAVIPVLTLGIPGSAPAAIVLAAMVLHGVRPGPMIMIESPSFVYEVVVMFFFASVAMFVLGILLTPLLLKVLSIPRERLMPVVFVLCVIGSYAIQQRMFDVWVMAAFGIVGFVLREMKYPMAPLVLGIVLGDIFDKSFRRSWVIHDGDFLFYFTRPISVILMLMCVATIVMSIGPCRRYIGPKIQAAMSATVGLVTGFVRAHFALVVILVASRRGGKASEGASLSAMSVYFGILADTIVAFVRAYCELLLGPFVDLGRLVAGTNVSRVSSTERSDPGPARSGDDR